MDPTLVQLLRELAGKARADGLHDFGAGIGPSAGDAAANAAFTQGVSNAPPENWTEDTVMNKTLGLDVRALLASIPDVTTPGYVSANYRVLPSVAFPSLKPYTIRKVALGNPDGTWKEGIQLAIQLGLLNPDGSPNSSLLHIDFNHHDFLARLKYTDPAAPQWAPFAIIGYLFTSATVNDPASKTPPTDTMFSQQTGVNLRPHVQTSGSILFPGRRVYNPATPTHNLVSNYDIELSGIREKKMTLGSRTKRVVSLNVTDGARTIVVDDSKGQNSRGALEGFLGRLLTRLREVVDPSTPALVQPRFELSTKWTQKRSGDWLQVLYLALLPLLTFEPELPANPRGYFVSHDRIAVGYALEQGRNVIYFKDMDAYVFSNDAEDEATRLARLESLLAPLRQQEARMRSLVTLLLNQQSTAMGVHLQAITDIGARLTQGVAAAVAAAGQGQPSPYNLTNLETDLKEFFGAALSYVALEKAYPDRVSLFELVDSADLSQKYTGLQTISTLLAQHREDPNIPATFYSQLAKSMTGRTLTDWSIEPKVGILGRLKGLVRTGSPDGDYRDSYAFLAFIQNSKDDAFKDRIATGMRALQGQLIANPSVLGSMGAKTGSRMNRVQLGLNGLFEQVYLFCKTVPPPTAQQDIGTFATGAAPPGVDADADGPAVANPLTVPSLLLTKAQAVSVPDAADDRDPQGGQRGGWPAGSRISRGTEIDSSQCVDPILYFHVDALRAQLQVEAPIDDTPVGFVGGRRPLYGGSSTVTITQTSAQTVTSPAASQMRDVVASLILDPAVRDCEELTEAPPPVLRTYSLGIGLLKALLALPPSPQTTLAFQTLCLDSAFLTPEDYHAVFSMTPEDATTLRLFFSALPDAQRVEPPADASRLLRAAASQFAPAWASVVATPVQSATDLLAAATALRTSIYSRYGATQQTYGTVLDSTQKAPQSREGLREARLAYYTRRAGSRKPLYRRTYRRRRTPTTP